MAGPRQLVSPPIYSDRPFGLLSVVQARYEEPDAHWRNGVTWQDICGVASTTYDPYCLATGSGTTPATKVANVTTPLFGATPFTVFAEVDCSPVGYSQQEQRARAVDALTRSEPWQVENAFWTGAAGGDPNIVFPHLAANAAVQDPNISNVQLQCAATPVTGSVVLDIVEAFGRLEKAAGDCYDGQITLHVPLILGQAIVDHHLCIDSPAAQFKTKTGNLIALGAGYTGSAPDGTLTPGVAWVYATGPVFAYRTQPETFNFREMLDRSTNTLKTIVERTYVLGYSCCCLLAVAVSTGGDPTGLNFSAS